MNPGKLTFGTALVWALCAGSPAQAQINGFGGTGVNWTLNTGQGSGSSPTIANDVLQVADSADSGTSAFYDTPQYIGSFTASFTWQNVSAGTGAGFTLCLQNTGTNAVGNVGGNYLGFVPIPLATGVAFNILKSATPGLGYAPVSVPFGTPVPYTPTGLVNFDATNAIGVQVAYANNNLVVTVTDTVTGATFSTNFAQNLTAAAGGSTALVGFTGGGVEMLDVVISNFVFTPGTPPPPPTSFPVVFTNSGGNIDVTKLNGNESDAVIAYDPVTPTTLFIAANTNVQAGLFGAYSVDSGTTWTPVSLANLPPGAYPAVAWDGYGNLFLAYADGAFSGIDVAISTNGGMNFDLMTNLATGDFALEPRIAAGTGSALGSVWVLYKDFSLANNPLVAQGAAVTGTNAFGAFGPAEFIPGSTNDCGFGDIAVGPQGQVMVVYQNHFDLAGGATNYVSVDLDGLGASLFSPPVVAAANVVGGNTLLPASPDGQGINGGTELAWDTDPTSQQYGRVYLVCVGFGSADATDTDIFLNSSTDGGATWGAQVEVNDDGGVNSKFLPRAAVDPTSGILALSWYDSRERVTSVKTNFMTNIDMTMTPPVTNTSTNFMTNMSSPSAAVIYATVSLNGGVSFQPNMEITSDTVNGYVAPQAVSPTDFGDYMGLTFYGGTFYPVWADNSGSAGQNPDFALKQTNFDISVAPTVLSGLADVSVTSIITNTTNLLQIGSVINYFLTVSNGGPTAVKGVSFVDVFPPQESVVLAFPTNNGVKDNYVLHGNTLSWTVGALAVNGTATILVRTTAVGIGNATNFAAISPGPGVTDLLTNNNSTTLVSTIYGADLALSISATPPLIGYGGPPVNFTVTVTNLGPVAATGVIISNVLSKNLLLTGISLEQGETYSTNTSQNSVVISVGAMTNGEVVTVGLTATAPLTAAALGFGPATCTSVALGVVDPTYTNNAASAATQIAPADLALSLTGAPSTMTVGDTVTFTVNVTNLGPVPAFVVTVTNFLPTNLQFTGASLPGTYTSIPDVKTNGQTDIIATFSGSLLPGQSNMVTITATALSLGQATNRVVVGDAAADTNSANNSARLVIPVVSSDLALVMTGTPSSVPVGQNVTYTLNVSNLGPVAAAGVVLTNTLPANVSLAGLSAPAGATYSINQNVILFTLGALTNGQTAQVTITANVLSTGNATNSAIVGDSLADTNLANNSAKVVTTITAATALFSNLTVGPGVTGLFITWNTPNNSTSQVDYGLTTASNVSYLNPTLTTNHAVLLTGLTPDTNYVFQVRSVTPAVAASDITNASSIVVMNGSPATLYTTNGTFSTTASLIFGTADASYSGIGWTIGANATGIFNGPSNNNPSYEYVQGVSGNPTASATYTPGIGVPGLYDVSIWYPTKAGAFSSNTPMIVSGATNAILTNVNQTINGGSWQPVSTDMYFAAGLAGNLSIYNYSGDTTTSVAANGARWVYDQSQDAPTSNSALPAWWANHYFGTNAAGATATNINGAFTNLNGYSYFAEYVLGTDPTSSSNQLQFVATPGPSTNVTVTFGPYQGGRIYQLQSSGSLGNPAWLTLTNTAALNTNTGSGFFTVGQTPGATVFYRLAASLAPNQ